MRDKHRRGFTLIEMLTVVAIIGLLAALLLTAVMRARTEAWRHDAKDRANQLMVAWTSYLQDNLSFPTATGTMAIAQMDANTIKYLNTGTRYNQFTPYMEFTALEQTNGFRDHWNNIFQVALDDGNSHGDAKAYDGQVTIRSGLTLTKSVATWSYGPDGKDGTDDDCNSW